MKRSNVDNTDDKPQAKVAAVNRLWYDMEEMQRQLCERQQHKRDNVALCVHMKYGRLDSFGLRCNFAHRFYIQNAF